ncbi:MAG: pyridoxamine 5'-phosphate oxidase family protein [Promethearchaeota archaeon]
MEPYNLRRAEKKINNDAELQEILQQQSIFTLAMTNALEPYLVTMDYAFDSNQHCIYFHCASKGKKVEFLQQNPQVYGQVIEDLGYMKGECDHAFRSVHFWGKVEFISDFEEKVMALKLLIKKFETDTEKIYKKFMDSASIQAVSVGRILIKGMCGKKSKNA